MTGNLEIKAVLHEHIELDAQQASLGQQSTMLLDHGKEMGGSIVIGEHHSLAA